MPPEQETFFEQTRKLGYPVETCPPEYRKQWFEGERASFDDEPHSCRYQSGTDEAFWWDRGFAAAEAVTAAVNEETE